MLCYLETSKVRGILKGLENVHFKGEVSLNHYIVFQKFLTQKYYKLEKTVKDYGVITDKRLKELMTESLDKDQVCTMDNLINTFIMLLDKNGFFVYVIIFNFFKEMELLIVMSFVEYWKIEVSMELLIQEKELFNLLNFLRQSLDYGWQKLLEYGE